MQVSCRQNAYTIFINRVTCFCGLCSSTFPIKYKLIEKRSLINNPPLDYITFYLKNHSFPLSSVIQIPLQKLCKLTTISFPSRVINCCLQDYSCTKRGCHCEEGRMPRRGNLLVGLYCCRVLKSMDNGQKTLVPSIKN